MTWEHWLVVIVLAVAVVCAAYFIGQMVMAVRAADDAEWLPNFRAALEEYRAQRDTFAELLRWLLRK